MLQMCEGNVICSKRLGRITAPPVLDSTSALWLILFQAGYASFMAQFDHAIIVAHEAWDTGSVTDIKFI